jgi:very-short-patch-repair endonuclease
VSETNKPGNSSEEDRGNDNGSVGQEPTMQRIARSLEGARRELIDISRRNRLLHSPRSMERTAGGESADTASGSGGRPRSSRSHCLEFQNVDLDTVFGSLRESKVFGFDAQMLEGNIPADRSRGRMPLRFQTQLASDALERRLLRFFREARVIEEEQGVNILFLVFGFLKWFEDARSEQVSWAPLILFPVALERRQGGDQFILKSRDDDLVANVSLRERLRQTAGIELPDLPEEDDWLPSAYLKAVASAVTREDRWAVDFGACGLGFFTFSKFLMWRDLDAATWPDPLGLLTHSRILSLFGEGSGFAAPVPIIDDDEPIDRRIDLAKAVHVLDADSSQAIAIEEARSGADLVIQGPPGTGKSQTIANIIASAVHEGRSVLFVAEKAAALEVVHSRLKNVGLDPLCLELHSRKATKTAVLASIEKALRVGVVAAPNGGTTESLSTARDRLNRWTEILHHPIGSSGRTPYQVMGQVLRLRADGTKVLADPILGAGEWDANRLRAVEDAVDKAAAAAKKLGTSVGDHPWRGVGAERLSPFDVERLRTVLDGAALCAGRMAKLLADTRSSLRASNGDTLEIVPVFLRALRLLAQIPTEGAAVLINGAWRSDRKRIAAVLKDGRVWQELEPVLADRLTDAAWDVDFQTAHQNIAAYGRLPFRSLIGSYRRAIRDLRAVCRGEPPRRYGARLQLAEHIVAAQTAGRRLESETEFAAATFGPLWARECTQWGLIGSLLNWVEQADALKPSVDLLEIGASGMSLRWDELANELEMVAGELRTNVDRITSIAKLDLTTALNARDWDQVPVSEISNRVEAWRKALETINDWITARDAFETARGLGAEVIVRGLIDGTITPNEGRPILDLLLGEVLWRKARTDDPRLDEIDGTQRTETVEKFRDLDRRRIELARYEVLSSYLAQRPQGGIGEMGIIRDEIGKKRRHLPLRKLMERAGGAVQRIKPVFLMSPLSVAQFLPPGRITFDLLVIDEASQVAPEDALGAVARARQIIVVGDDKQLPPTNFFRLAMNDDDDEVEDEELEPARTRDFESILTLGRARGMAERMLHWHYRSRHPSLIAVSNQACYGGSLLLPPSPLREDDQLGLSLVPSPRGHYDRGGTGRNQIEAELVAEYVERHLVECPDQSLGVACFSVAQRNAIDDALYSRHLTSAVEAFAPNGERLFVKNLETVQGDERDVIFISVGYGKDPQGRISANFGPISHDGGERRLNVLISRARSRCMVFSSILSGDIPADAKPLGTRMLRDFLYFVETGKFAAGQVTGYEFDSPFEEAVALAITRAGYDVQPQVGVSGFRIDLGVLDPRQPGRFILGIECDGAIYHSARCARDRDRLRQEVLERQGWRLYRIWSTDWFSNPEREAKRLIEAIEAACAFGWEPKPTAQDTFSGAPTHSEPPHLFEAQSELNLPIPEQTPAYTEFRPSVPSDRTLHALGAQQLADIVVSVVEAEGPIHLEEVARRVREAFGLDRTGSQIRKAVQQSLRLATRQQRLIAEEPFWSAPRIVLSRLRDRRHSTPSVRRADRISPLEFCLSIRLAIEAAISLSSEEVCVQAARLLGFDRTGPDLQAAITGQLQSMLARGEVYENGGRFHLSPRA